PAGLVPFRLAGYQLIIWRAKPGEAEWQRRIARARALELRLYVVCIVEGVHAFAVDPDGLILCGTFPDFAIATFAFDPSRTQNTFVAPNTDILEGLQRVRSRKGGESGVHAQH
ncbi:MAG: hypothetical protein M3N19_02140, partial [Candidatus Eremiobacteraeota bacterium]|nr:hypothetical protein [Candidatus Eremiobacteraeota bacterium]